MPRKPEFSNKHNCPSKHLPTPQFPFSLLQHLGQRTSSLAPPNTFSRLDSPVKHEEQFCWALSCVSRVTERRKCQRSQSSHPHLKPVAVPLFQVIWISVEFPWEKNPCDMKDPDFTKASIHPTSCRPGCLFSSTRPGPLKVISVTLLPITTACSSRTIQTNSWAFDSLQPRKTITETDFYHHPSHVTTEAPGLSQSH